MSRPTRLGARVLAAALVTSVLAGCASAAPADSPRDRVTTTTPPSPLACSTPASSLTSGHHTLRDGEETRSYELHVPSSIPTRGAPLIIGLHGYGGSARDLESRSHLGERGAATGAIVVLPDALGSPARWNFDRRPAGPDDYGFIAHLIDHLDHHLCIAPGEAYVAGSSNGAAFAGLLACTAPYRFSAVAMVIATVPSGCPPAVSPSILTIRGTDDRHVRFEGTPTMVASDAAREGCDPEPLHEHLEPSVQRTRYHGCRNGAEVVLDAVRGGTHRWPTEADVPAYDATGAILAFFTDHRHR